MSSLCPISREVVHNLPKNTKCCNGVANNDLTAIVAIRTRPEMDFSGNGFFLDSPLYIVYSIGCRVSVAPVFGEEDPSLD